MIELKSYVDAGRVHAVVMVPIDETSQPSTSFLAITHLALVVQNDQSL
jgi:hypothetical protein